MIRGVHTMFYTSDAPATRAFLRDKLGFPFTDVGDGWLIFDLPEADMGCHPSGASDPGASPPGTHAISFYCDDVNSTVSKLKARGVEFRGGVTDQGWGLVTQFNLPGVGDVQLYEPKYRKRSTGTGSGS